MDNKIKAMNCIARVKVVFKEHHIASIILYIKELENQVEDLNRSVKEWICVACNKVFPGYPHVVPSFSLICPECSRAQLVKRDSSAEVNLLRSESEKLKGKLVEFKCTCDRPTYENAKWCWNCNKIGRDLYNTIMEDS